MTVRLMARLWVCLLGTAGPLAAQADGRVSDPLPPGYGSLTQNDLSLIMRNSELEIRFVPLDQGVLRLLARDSYQAMHSLIRSRRAAIDSIANLYGLSRPGLALVSFFGLTPNVRFDAQTLTLVVRNRLFRPVGIVAHTPRFTSQQLNVREQVSAIYVYEEEIPVEHSFSLAYNGLRSDDWQGKQRALDRERARVAARTRANQPDSAP
ncbi:MAG: hypothetical protein ACREMX_15510 [Gemmatimonadales bacterium]